MNNSFGGIGSEDISHESGDKRLARAATRLLTGCIFALATVVFLSAGPSPAQAQFVCAQSGGGDGGATAAGGAGAFACGTNASVNGSNSTAIGNNATTGTFFNSTAVGSDAGTTGNAATAVGRESTAAGEGSAFGKSSQATGDKASAFGNTSQALGENSSAFGQAAQATQDNASAFGQSSTASGVGSTAVGVGASASGTNSFAAGFGADAAGTGGIAVGTGAVTGTGVNSMAIGAGAATGNFANAAAFGAGATVTRDNQQVFGTASNTYTMVGITSGASVGAQTGPLSVVTTDANGNLAGNVLVSSLGGNNECVETVQGALSCGTGSSAAGANSTAIGQNANASGNNSSAFGNGATASGENSVALGAGSVAGAANTVSVGAPGAERRITNVAAGVDPTDAVNVSQLSALGANLQSEINSLGRRDQELADGIAISLALAQPIMTANQTFAMRVGWGNFDGSNAIGFSAAGVLNRGYAGPTSSVVLDGGVGMGANENVVAGRAGVTFGW